jgi:hypothetical protein
MEISDCSECSPGIEGELTYMSEINIIYISLHEENIVIV